MSNMDVSIRPSTTLASPGVEKSTDIVPKAGGKISDSIPAMGTETLTAQAEENNRTPDTVRSVSTDAQSLEDAVKSMSDSGKKIKESLEDLHADLSKNSKYADMADGLCHALRAQLNHCLTAGDAHKADAFSQLQSLVNGFKAQCAKDKVESEAFDKILGVGEALTSVSSEVATHEEGLEAMLACVMSNSNLNITGEQNKRFTENSVQNAEEFASDVIEQREIINTSVEADKVQENEGKLKESINTVRKAFVSDNLLQQMEAPPRPIETDTPEVADTRTLSQINAHILLSKTSFAALKDAGLTPQLEQLLDGFENNPAAISILERCDAKQVEILLNSLKACMEEPLSSDNLKSYAEHLDTIFTPTAQLRENLWQIKSDMAASLSNALTDAEFISALRKEHQLHAGCCEILDFLPKDHALHKKSFMDVTAADLKDIIQNHEKKYVDIPNVLLFNVYMELGLAQSTEQPDGTRTAAYGEDDLIKDLPKPWLDTLPLVDLSSQGVTSSAQLDHAESLLSSGVLSKKARNSIKNMLTQSRSDGNSVQANTQLRNLATMILDITNVSDDISTSSLLTSCAKKLGFVAHDSTGIANALNALNEKDAQMTKIEDTFKAMQIAQGAKSLAETRGETWAMTTLALQRLVVRDASELSDTDLALIGAKREDVDTPEHLKEFVENKWERSDKTDWVTTVLLTSYSNLPKDPSNPDNAPMFTQSQKDACAKLKIQQNANEYSLATALNSLQLTDSLTLQLSKGVTREATFAGKARHSDFVGGAFKELCRQYTQCLSAEGNSKGQGKAAVNIPKQKDFIVNGVRIDTTKTTDLNVLRKAIVDILNGAKVTETGGNEHKYLPPTQTSRAALIYCTDNKGASNSAINRLNAIAKDVYTKQGFKQASVNTLIKSIEHDFSQLAALNDRQGDAKAKLRGEFMNPLLKNPTFTTQILPLALLEAQRICNCPSASALLNPVADATLQGRKDALGQAFVAMGCQAADATLLVNSLFETQVPPAALSVIEKGADTLLSAFSFAANITRLTRSHEVSDTMKSFLQQEAIRNDTKKLFEDLQNNTVFRFENTLSANLKGAVPVGAASISGSFSIGKNDAFALWKNAEGKPCITISQAVLAKVGLGASIGIGKNAAASVGVGVHGSAEKSLELTFDDTTKAAQFAALFLTNVAGKNDLTLSSRAAFGGVTIGGVELSGSVGSTHEGEQVTLSLSADFKVGAEKQVETKTDGFSSKTKTTSIFVADGGVRLKLGPTDDSSSEEKKTVFNAGVAQGDKTVDTTIERGEDGKINTSAQIGTELSRGNTSATLETQIGADGIEVEAQLSHQAGFTTGNVTGTAGIDISKDGIDMAARLNYTVQQSLEVETNLAGNQLLSASCTDTKVFSPPAGSAAQIAAYCDAVSIPQATKQAILAYVENSNLDTFSLDLERTLTNIPTEFGSKQAMNNFVGNPNNYAMSNVTIGHSNSVQAKEAQLLFIKNEESATKLTMQQFPITVR